MNQSRRVSWLAVVALVGALALFPAMASAQSQSIEITIDSPTSSLTVANGQTIDIGGWAVDDASTVGTGIDTVEIWIDGQRGTGAQRIVATYGTARPDVAQTFSRPDWRNSGFDVHWVAQGLADGQHTLTVYAHSERGDWASSAVTIAASTPTTVGVVASQPVVQFVPVAQQPILQPLPMAQQPIFQPMPMAQQPPFMLPLPVAQMPIVPAPAAAAQTSGTAGALGPAVAVSVVCDPLTMLLGPPSVIRSCEETLR